MPPLHCTEQGLAAPCTHVCGTTAAGHVAVLHVWLVAGCVAVQLADEAAALPDTVSVQVTVCVCVPDPQAAEHEPKPEATHAYTGHPCGLHVSLVAGWTAVQLAEEGAAVPSTVFTQGTERVAVPLPHETEQAP